MLSFYLVLLLVGYMCSFWANVFCLKLFEIPKRVSFVHFFLIFFENIFEKHILSNLFLDLTLFSENTPPFQKKKNALFKV